MTHKLTHTPNYLLVVDDSDIKEIKEGDFLYSISNKLVVCANKGSADDINSKVMPEAIHKKIIAHLPLNNSSILQGVDLLPPLEDDVKKLAKEYIDDEWQKDDDAVKFGIKVGYVQGYNKAKEKYRFTEEDMRKAIEFGYDLRNNHKAINSGIDWVKILTQSLQPKTEWEVEIVDGKLKLI